MPIYHYIYPQSTTKFEFFCNTHLRATEGTKSQLLGARATWTARFALGKTALNDGTEKLLGVIVDGAVRVDKSQCPESCKRRLNILTLDASDYPEVALVKLDLLP